MRKTLCIAAREYRAAVYTKAFIISVVLLPLMMFGGILMQKVSQRIGDATTKRVAVLDRTPGAVLFPALEREASRRNETEILDKATGKQMHARFVFEKTEPQAQENADAVLQQRYELSERIRKGELFAVVEIGGDILKPRLGGTNVEKARQSLPAKDGVRETPRLEAVEEMMGETNLIRYTSNQPTYTELMAFLQRTLPQEIYLRRINAAELPAEKVLPLLIPPQITQGALVSRDAAGHLAQDANVNQVAATLVPLALLMLMFMVVMVGTSPLAMNVIEEKQLRIAEVLLGSVRPFELMMGKLLGGVGVALTLGAIYLAGILGLALQYGVAGYVPAGVLGWFAVFTVMAALMYGSIFVAAGAAVTNVKEAQALIAPIMLFIMLPMFIIQPLLQNPSGPMPLAASFFPLSAPMMTTARLAIPPGIPLWQALVSVAISLLTTVGLVWCAGRIFRVGLLMQGQAAKPRELVKWIWKG